MRTPIQLLGLLTTLELACMHPPSFEEVERAEEPADAGREVRLDVPEPSPPSGSDGVRLGFWNVRRLGHHPATDVPLLARLIDQHFDLIALAEVMHTGASPPDGYASLLASLGPAWAGQVTATPRPNISAPFAEYYAVLWRVTRFEPCDASSSLWFVPDGSRTGRPPMTEAGIPERAPVEDVFLREPAFGCYRAMDSGVGPGPDFMLGVYHARWGEGDPEEIAREVEHVDAALAHVSLGHPGERDIFLFGDFNLGSAALSEHVQAVDYTRGSGSTLQPNGGVSGNLLDHLLVLNPDASPELPGAAQVLDLRGQAGPGSAYLERVSDHLPLRVLMDPGQGDDD